MNSRACSMRSDLTLLQEAQRRMEMAPEGSDDAAGLSQVVMSKVEAATQICRNGGRPEIDYAVCADKRELVTHIGRKLIRNKAQYQAVEARTGVPWFVIAALHNRESDADFSTYLGNGEPLNRKTTLVPKGRGPFENWQA